MSLEGRWNMSYPASTSATRPGLRTGKQSGACGFEKHEKHRPDWLNSSRRDISSHSIQGDEYRKSSSI